MGRASGAKRLWPSKLSWIYRSSAAMCLVPKRRFPPAKKPVQSVREIGRKDKAA